MRRQFEKWFRLTSPLSAMLVLLGMLKLTTYVISGAERLVDTSYGHGYELGTFVEQLL
ncbi:hypothetical protein [Paenibacillus methanolicus]|uniref:Uncharacterized protein n=1 Tax=Paenibacillus methanolicus TaxID=582686 RepID=A0A5S5CH06_9BACL|nr:hypothetical protein [Paenibacillus methanolicus]TYP79069.1 hypothetical protein BCM02_101185 [Paenibacillus methanolicus]